MGLETVNAKRIDGRNCCHYRRQQTILPHCRLSRCDRHRFAFRLLSVCVVVSRKAQRVSSDNRAERHFRTHARPFVSQQHVDDDDGDDGDGAVPSVHAAVNGERVSTYGLW